MRPVSDLQRKVSPFQVISDYVPAGDQPVAIEEIARRINDGVQDVVLLGATGTGKSATTAWLVEKLQRPTLVLAPNKKPELHLVTDVLEIFKNPNNISFSSAQVVTMPGANATAIADNYEDMIRYDHLHNE